MILLRRIALCIYTFSINFEILELSGSGLFSVAKLSAIIYLSTLIGDIQKFITIKGIKEYTRPIFILFGLISIMTLININDGDGSLFNIPFLLNIIFFIIIINHSRIDPKAMQSAIIAFALGSILVAIFYYLKIGVSYEFGRVSIFGDNQNAIGVKQAISILICIYYGLNLIENKKKLLPLILLLGTPLMFQLLLETGSRKAIIGVFLGVIIGILFLKTKSFKFKLIILIGGVYIFFSALELLMNSEVLIKRLTATAESGDLAGRDRIWKAILPLIADHPFFGVGESGFYIYSVKTFGAYNSPHNVLIEILAYSGIFGLYFYLKFLFKLITQSIKSLFKYKSWISLVLLIQVLGFIIAGQALGSKVGWLVFSFVIYTTYSNNKKIHPLSLGTSNKKK